MRSRSGLRALAALALLVAACGRPEVPPLRVFASASLTAALEELAEEWARSRGLPQPELHFAGTPQLLLQLREGARADVLATADEIHMKSAETLGLLSGPSSLFARNALAIAVAPGNPHGIHGLADLAQPGLLVALCGPEVPAGRYARRALAAAGLHAESRSDEPSVKALVAKVALGELDAGVVYRTDVRAAGDAVDGVPLSDGPVADYPVAALAGSQEAAADFIAYLCSTDGAAVLARHGFESP